MSITTNELWQLLQDTPLPKPVFYRVYYNDDGSVICYTMEDLPGKYIEIDQHTYALSKPNVRVVNEQLVEIVPKPIIRKLTPGEHGIACHPADICVVVNDSTIKWSIKTNEVD